MFHLPPACLQEYLGFCGDYNLDPSQGREINRDPKMMAVIRLCEASAQACLNSFWMMNQIRPWTKLGFEDLNLSNWSARESTVLRMS